MFNGALGTWKTDPVDLKSKYYAKQIFSRPHPVTKVHEEMFKKEFEHWVLIQFLELATDLEWGAPYFAQPKPKSNQVHFLIDFRNINKN